MSNRNLTVRVRCIVEKLHRGEEGMETVQIIMIMAIAAMVLTGVNQIVGVNSGGSTGSGLISMVTGGLSKLFGGEGLGLGDLGGLIGGLF